MLLRRALLAVSLVVVWDAGAWAQRLPGGVRPEHYSLVITPDLSAARFSGSETIEVVLDQPTSAITLNAAEIEFGVVKAWAWAGAGAKANANANANAGILRSAQNDKQEVDEGQTAVVALDAAKEQAIFTFSSPLPAGQVTLEIAYKGILNDKLRGFYLSKTKLRNYGVTQFEATDARRAFPSFDEPALKATFDVTLVVDQTDVAISNMQVVSDVAGPVAGKHAVRFATTPKMSTYLVAWVVGDFVCSQGKSDGVPIRVCSTPDKVGLTKFALEAAKWDLHYFDKYFGIKYPMAKLDMVALPDFESGAMENFGCITYRETELLVDEKSGTLPSRKDVVTTVAHEIAHQWFGDLVTPGWWDNLWLNEGFATWMETKAAAKWRPDWRYDQDEASDLNRTLDEDGERTTRPIVAKAETPAQINELFDDIAYGKAGAVIGMVENWLGEEVFQRGVHEYLAAHLYGNARAEDFWDAQAKVSGQPVDKVMRSFVEQPGVPEVTLMPSGAGVSVMQRRYAASDASTRGEAWTIPVCFVRTPCRLLTPEAKELDVPAPVSQHPLIYANARNKGYYRTAYAPAQRAAIVANLETGLTAPERIGFLGDDWALMQTGETTVGEFLDLVLAVKQDTNATVLESAMNRVGLIGSRIATDEDRVRLDSVVRQEFGPVYAAMGGRRMLESHDHADLRETLFEGLGQAKDPAVLADAASMTKQIFAGQKSADPKIADAAIALTTPAGDAAMYDRLVRVCREATDPDFKESAQHALTRFDSPELVKRTLEYALSDEVRSQDSWALIALLLERRETQDQAWAFVQQHWADMQRKATENSGARVVEAAGEFCSVQRRDEVASFFAAHPAEASERTLAKSLDRINDCVRLRAAQEPELRKWLDAHGNILGGG